jgi:hypothetical protein
MSRHLTSSAPYTRMVARRSSVMLSGIISTICTHRFSFQFQNSCFEK